MMYDSIEELTQRMADQANRIPEGLVCLEHVNTTDAGRTESGLITG